MTLTVWMNFIIIELASWQKRIVLFVLSLIRVTTGPHEHPDLR